MLQKSLILQTSKVLDVAKARFSDSIKSLEEGGNRCREDAVTLLGVFPQRLGFFSMTTSRLEVLLNKSALFSIRFQVAVIGKSFSEGFKSCLESSTFKVLVFIYSQIVQ